MIYFIKNRIKLDEELEEHFKELLKKSNLMKMKNRMYVIFKPIIQNIYDKDESLFKNSFMLIPNIDLSDFWNQTREKEEI